jgi:hypothetical protein
MVRRLLWLTVGAGAGAWLVLKVQRAASHLTPSGLGNDAQRYVRHLGADVRAAAREAQRTKREVETALRAAPRGNELARPIEATSTHSA